MYVTSKKKFGDYIKKVRIEKGLSREELANKLFVTAGAISKWENGKRYPDFETLGNLANVLGISTQDIYDNSREDKDKNIRKIINMMSIILLLGAVTTGIVLGVINKDRRNNNTAGKSSDDYVEGRAIRIEQSGDLFYAVDHCHDTRLLVDIEGAGPTYIDMTVEGVMDARTGDKVRLIPAEGYEIMYSVTYPGQAQNIGKIEVIESGSRKNVQEAIDKLIEKGILSDVTCTCVSDDMEEATETAVNDSQEEKVENSFEYKYIDPKIPYEKLSAFGKAYRDANDTQKAQLIQLGCDTYGRPDVYFRKIKLIMNEIPENQARITVEQAKEICEKISKEYKVGESQLLTDYAQKYFDEIAGAPDIDDGSGLRILVYYIDDAGTEQITVYDFKITYNKADYTLIEELYSWASDKDFSYLNEKTKYEMSENVKHISLETAKDIMNKITYDELVKMENWDMYLAGKMDEVTGGPDCVDEKNPNSLKYIYFLDDNSGDYIRVDHGAVMHIDANGQEKEFLFPH